MKWLVSLNDNRKKNILNKFVDNANKLIEYMYYNIIAFIFLNCFHDFLIIYCIFELIIFFFLNYENGYVFTTATI